MSTLEKAIAIACEAHRGQLDKAGAPYILHPLRLMLRMDTQEERIVAVLHDTLEDSELDADDLKAAGFSATIIEAVRSLTKVEGESYQQFVDRAASNPIARKVKLADVEDNMNLLRLEFLTDKDLKRLAKYHAAWRRLQRD